MSAILEAVRGEIAEAEKAKAAVDRRLKRLRAIEELAEVDDDDEQRPEPAAKPEPKVVSRTPPKPRRASSPRSTRNTEAESERRGDELRELLTRLGPQTEAEMRNATGWTAKSVQKALLRLQARGAAGPTGEARSKQGNPSREWKATTPTSAEEAESPEPAAPASTTDDAGADLDDMELLEDPDESDDDVDDQAVDVGDYDDAPRKPRGGPERLPDRLRPLAERIKATCELEPKSAPGIAEATGIDRREVRGIVKTLVKLNELQAYGAEKRGSTAVAKYRVPPKLEDLGVTVKQVERSDNLEQDILERLHEDGPLSIKKLAAALCHHPRDVAAGVSALIARDEVSKRPGFPDAVYQLAGAEIGRPGLPALP